MPWLKKYALWLLLIISVQAVSIGQVIDTTRKEPSDSAKKTPSPIGPNSFNIDSLIKTTEHPVLFVKSITVEGNRFTRKSILLRELPFGEGDSVILVDLPEIFARAKTQIMNTTLFHRADISVTDVDGANIDLKITIKERWYIIPLPYVKPVDRSLHEWLFNKGGSLDRLDYGVKLSYDNLTGEADKLRFYLITGYTKQLQLSYNRPYIDKNMKWGFNINLAMGKTHEINHLTRANERRFFNDTSDGGYVRNFSKNIVEFSYRPAFYTKHFFGFGYHTLKVADTILQLNPDFLPNGARQVRYPELYYKLVYQNLDYIPYPTEGYAGEVLISKQGFNKNFNVWQLTAKGQGNWHLTPKIFYNISALGTVKLPLRQPYINSQLLGYGDMTLRGYEKYVIDGVAGGMLNATLYKQLTNFSFSLPFLRWFTDRLIPLKLYAKVYGNAGYVYSKDPRDNHLSNRTLVGCGFGFDLWTVNDFTFKFEFSFNQLGQSGPQFNKKTLF